MSCATKGSAGLRKRTGLTGNPGSLLRSGDDGWAVVLPAGLARLTAALEPAAVASGSHWLRLVDGEISAPELVPVELGNRATCAVSVVHLDKCESSRLACGAVTDVVDSGDRS